MYIFSVKNIVQNRKPAYKYDVKKGDEKFSGRKFSIYNGKRIYNGKTSLSKIVDLFTFVLSRYQTCIICFVGLIAHVKEPNHLFAA